MELDGISTTISTKMWKKYGQNSNGKASLNQIREVSGNKVELHKQQATQFKGCKESRIKQQSCWISPTLNITLYLSQQSNSTGCLKQNEIGGHDSTPFTYYINPGPQAKHILPNDYKGYDENAKLLRLLKMVFFTSLCKNFLKCITSSPGTFSRNISKA